MKLGRIDGRTPHRKDADVALALQAAKSRPGSRGTVLVAFRNEAGDVYRYASLQGLSQLRFLKTHLAALHLMAGSGDERGVLAVLGHFQEPEARTSLKSDNAPA